MIHYQLRCNVGHEFGAWFRDSAAYGEQAARGLLECPVCGERTVRQALMAPSLSRRTQAPSAETAPAETPKPSPPEIRAAGLPDQVRAALQRLRTEVEKRCEYVGDQFAAEARRIHDGESERRGIYGEATPHEAERLADDGIDVSRIPWLPRSDA